MNCLLGVMPYSYSIIIIKEGDELHKLLSDKKVICFLVLPGFIIFTFAVLFPIFLSVFYGMTDWSGIGDYTFIGMANFKDVILDGTFWASLKNAFILTLLTIFIQHPIALLFAVFLDEIGGKMEKVFRTLLFIPCVISIVVTSKMWVSIYDSQYGMLNKILDGFEGKLTSSKWAKIAKCSKDTAIRDINDLINKTILRKEAAGGRSTNYELIK